MICSNGMPRLFNIWFNLKSDNTMYWKELVRDWGSFHLPYYGWYLDCPLDYTPILERSKQKKFDMGFWEKLASSQGNKKEDIDKKKKKKDVQVSSTLRVIQTLANIENLEQDVNAELFEF